MTVFTDRRAGLVWSLLSGADEARRATVLPARITSEN